MSKTVLLLEVQNVLQMIDLALKHPEEVIIAYISPAQKVLRNAC